MSGHISGLDARMVLDSRGQPTVEVDCFVDGGLLGRAIVPSGASTGAYEALEMRDGDANIYLGKGVDQAVNNVKDHLVDALVGLPVDEQRIIDEVMIELDGTANKSNLGATPCWAPPWPACTPVQHFTNFLCGSMSEASQAD